MQGLWDNITSEQAVDLVGRWLKEYDPSKEAVPPDLAATPASMADGQTPDAPNSSQAVAYTKESPANESHFTVTDSSQLISDFCFCSILTF